MYLDPGFGSMVIQMVIAGIASAGAGLFIFRQKIKELFHPSKNGDTNTVEENSNIRKQQNEESRNKIKWRHKK